MIESPKKVGLASASPRRAALLASMGLQVVALRSGIDESRQAGEPLTQFVERLALEKAAFGCGDPLAADLPVIAGDTIVSLQGEVLEKPRDAAHAQDMLSRLSGRTHQVLTGVAVRWESAEQSAVVISEVTFSDIDEATARAYWASGEPQGKAGGYAIQGLGARFVSHLSGSHSAVMGLPVFEVWQILTGMAKQRATQGSSDA